MRVSADQIPAGWKAGNMRPVGYSNLDGRGGAFKITIRHVGDRWYLYLGHLWNYGWSLVDVTDVKNPKVVKFVPGPPNTWTIQMEMHDNIMLTALQVQPPIWGGDPNKPHENQTEDVWLADTRGNIYITDKQWGLFILRYAGQGEPAPTAR